MKGAARTRTAGSVVLTARDLALAADAWAFGLLTRDQLRELHFGGAALRRANRRLTALVRSGLLASAPLPLGAHPLSVLLPASGGREAPPNGGGPQRAYRLGPRGAEAVAPYLAARGFDVDAETVRRRTATAETPGFAAHSLAVADARVALERAARRAGPWELLAFYGEALLSRRFEARSAPDAPWKLHAFKPDGLATVRHGGADRYLFVEIDLSSASSAEIARKLTVHALYRASLFSSRYGGAPPDSFFTLVLTTGAGRADNLARLAEPGGPAAEAGAFVSVATLADFAAPDADPLLSPIWRVPGRGGTAPLLTGGAGEGRP